MPFNNINNLDPYAFLDAPRDADPWAGDFGVQKADHQDRQADRLRAAHPTAQHMAELTLASPILMPTPIEAPMKRDRAALRAKLPKGER